MSRSKKKPYYTDQQRGRKSSPSSSVAAKRKANRAVRAQAKLEIREGSDKLSKGKQYRKVSDSWNIRDWSFYSPKDKKAYRK